MLDVTVQVLPTTPVPALATIVAPDTSLVKRSEAPGADAYTNVSVLQSADNVEVFKVAIED
jgi:hypothetical protein